MRPARTASTASPRLAWGLAACGLVAMALLFAPRTKLIASAHYDFLPFYVAAGLAPSADLYDEDPYHSFGLDRYGKAYPYLVYIRLPFYALLLKPLSWLPYSAATVAWFVLRLAAALALLFMRWGPGRGWVAAALCWSIPLFGGLFNGQDAILLPAVLACGNAVSRTRPRLAGLVWSLCAIKFHLFVTLPLVFVRRGGGELLRGFAWGAAGLVALSFLAGGASWPLRYAEVLFDEELMMVGAAASPTIMPNLHGLASALGAGPVLEWTAAAVVVGATAWVAPRLELGAALAAAAAAGVLVSYHCFVADWVVVLFAVLLMWRYVEANIAIRLLGIALLAPPVIWMQLLGPPYSAVPATLLLACWGAFLWEARREAAA